MSEIKIWDRQKGRETVEQVYGDKGIRWLYRTGLGRLVAEGFLSKRPVSQAVGWYHGSVFSRAKIGKFVKKFKIPMEEYEDPGYRSFNDFFIREFREGKRPFQKKATDFSAFAEGRYYAFEKIGSEDKLPVKGLNLTPLGILSRPEWAHIFKGGPVLLARLCPTDYHRFHFFDDGQFEDHYRIHGGYHSVNPLALQYRGDIFCANERHVSILKTKSFGYVAYVEVGAMMVGRIVQTHVYDQTFKRGDEKGYFLFGGSTVIVFGQKGKWIPTPEILEQTANGRETLVRLGEKIAQKK